MKRGKTIAWVILLFLLTSYVVNIGGPRPVLAANIDPPSSEHGFPGQSTCSSSSGFSTYGWPVVQNFANYQTGYYLGYHSGIDFARPDYQSASVLANGRVVKAYRVTNSSGVVVNGWVVVEHTGTFAIPAKSGSNWSYGQRTVTKIQTVYLHINPSVSEGTCVTKGDIVGYVAAGNGHVHLEVRGPEAQPSNDWSLVQPSSNWCRGNSGVAYYCNAQQMVVSGLVEPSSFLLSNAASSSSCMTVPANKWCSEYYSNRDLLGTPSLIRDDSNISFDWGSGGPGGNVGTDNFSARWRGRFTFNGYTKFTVTSDDGVRLWVDNTQYLNRWNDQPPTTFTVYMTMSGEHEVKVEYYERGGGATAIVRWETVGSAQQSCSSIPSGKWCAEYFDNGTLSGNPAKIQEDSAIDFDWGGGSPSGLPFDNFSIRWRGRFTFNGATTFTATADDGIRVYVDNSLIIDRWQDQGPTTYRADRALSGEHEVKVEYYERGGGAVARVSWQSGGSGTTLSCPSQYKAEYFANTTLSGTPSLVRCEDWPIAHNWGSGSPGSGVPSDNFSVRWTGSAFFAAGTYEFVGRTDDGMRAWVGAKAVIDSWKDQPPTTYKTRATYTADVQMAIKVEFYERGGGALAEFGWAQASGNGASSNLALNKPSGSSSNEMSSTTADAAVDGNTGTRWSSRQTSNLNDDEWLIIDLGQLTTINRVVVRWETAYAASYQIAYSPDGQKGYVAYQNTVGDGGVDDVTFSAVNARYVWVYCDTKKWPYSNYSIWEFEIYGTSGSSSLGAVQSPVPVDKIPNIAGLAP